MVLTSSAGQWTIDWQVGGQANSATCTLLVAADGTASSVRSRLEIDVVKHRYQFPIAVLYGRQLGVSSERTLDVHLTQERMVSLIPRVGGKRKWVSHIGRGARFWKREKEEVLHRQLALWCPGVAFDSLRFGAVYPPVAQQSKPYRGRGRWCCWRRAARDAPSAQHGNEYLLSRGDQLAIALNALNPGFSQARVYLFWPNLKRSLTAISRLGWLKSCCRSSDGYDYRQRISRSCKPITRGGG